MKRKLSSYPLAIPVVGDDFVPGLQKQSNGKYKNVRFAATSEGVKVIIPNADINGYYDDISGFNNSAASLLWALGINKYGNETMTIDGFLSLVGLYVSAGNYDVEVLIISNNPLLKNISFSSASILEEVILDGNEALETISLTNIVTLTDFSLTGCPLLKHLQLGGNALDVATINAILVELDGGGLSNGFANLITDSGAGIPTGAGAAAVTSLVGKGWTIQVDS